MKNYIILSLLFIFAACATTPFSETLSIYDRNQVAWSFSDGTGKVEGDGFLYRRDGMLVKCYGQQVNLIPVSDYAIERFTNIFGTPNGGYNAAGLGSRRVDEADPAYWDDSRKTVCDIDGKFIFNNLPSGEYYVSTMIVWNVNNYDYEGGVISKRIKVKDGETIPVSLSRLSGQQ